MELVFKEIIAGPTPNKVESTVLQTILFESTKVAATDNWALVVMDVNHTERISLANVRHTKNVCLLEKQ